MNNAVLFFRSLLIVFIVAGIPHALAIYAGSENEVTPDSSIRDTESPGTESPEPTEEKTAEPPDEEDWAYYWKGRYEVTFEGIKEKSVYEVREENGGLQCYSVVQIDASGNRYDDNTLLMKALKIDEYLAKAEYEISYEGQTYTVQSSLQMDEKGDIHLSYHYEGYTIRETWKRLQ